MESTNHYYESKIFLLNKVVKVLVLYVRVDLTVLSGFFCLSLS